jgi:hypothetical protein
MAYRLMVCRGSSCNTSAGGALAGMKADGCLTTPNGETNDRRDRVAQGVSLRLWLHLRPGLFLQRGQL